MPGAIPFSLDPDLIKISRTLFIQKDYTGVTQVLLWAARTDYCRKNRAAMVDFMEDVIRARHFFLDPANHVEALKIVTDFTKQPAALYDYAFTKEDTYRDLGRCPISRPRRRTSRPRTSLASSRTIWRSRNTPISASPRKPALG